MATDFFQIETVTFKRLYASLVLELGARSVQILRVTEYPSTAWVTQLARNFVAEAGSRADRFRYLIRDRDSITDAFDAVFAAEDIEINESTPQCPKMNASAERWVETVHSECADWMLVVGDRHLRVDADRHLRVDVDRYTEHYNASRTHQGHGLNLRARWMIRTSSRSRLTGSPRAKILAWPHQRIRHRGMAPAQRLNTAIEPRSQRRNTVR